MRKKLLALLMCATMVLGSSAVAFAAPSDDDWTAAGKVLSKGSDITAEYESANIKATAYVAGVGTGTYAFTTKAYNSVAKSYDVYDAVKVDSDTKALLYVGAPLDLTAYGTANDFGVNTTDVKTKNNEAQTGYGVATAGEYVNVSAVISYYLGKLSGSSSTDIATVQAAGKTYAAGKHASQLGMTDGIIVNIKNSLGTVEARWLTLKTDDDPTDASAVKWTDTGYNLTSSTVYGSKKYYTEDGYSFTLDKTDSINSYFKATKASGSDGSTYAYTVKQITADNTSNYADIQLSIAEAIAAGTLSTDARAVKLEFYQYYVGANNTPVLNKIVYPNATVSLPVANDLLSRTGLKAATVDAYFISDTMATDTDLNKAYNTLGLAGSTLDTSAAYKTFDLPIVNTASNGYVIIFDKSADESQNDGVADETTTTAAPAAETAATSPKTGDVAPIAALAVVMMGACGAMVVASKKRA
jgi:hypothetical protein